MIYFAWVTFHCQQCNYDLEVSANSYILPKEGESGGFCACITDYYVCPKCKTIEERGVGSEVKDEYLCKKCSTVLLQIDVEPPEYEGEEYLSDYIATCPICEKEMKRVKTNVSGGDL